MRDVVFAALAALMVGQPLSEAKSPSAPVRVTAPQLGDKPSLIELKERLAREAKAARARVGVAAIDLTTGDLVSVNGDQSFPMASTVKVAIAAAFLQGVQQGRLSLGASYSLPSSERSMARRLADMRATTRGRSGAELLEMMLTRSDNVAADILLGAIGGPQALGRWLHAAGASGQRVDRSIAQLLSDHETTRRMRVGRGRRRHWVTVTVPRAAPAGDERDSSTPEAMAALLAKLKGGELLDETRTAYLFDVMARCRTGPGRIRGLLPAGTPVAHKTGTMNGITSDVGIVGLPNGHQLAVAVFETGAGGVRAHDRKIAQLSRLLYDGFSELS